MLGESGRVALRAEIVEQARGTFDVGEEEGDGACRQVTHRREPPR